MARNLGRGAKDRPLEAFTFHDKGFVVSVRTHRGVAVIAGISSGGQLAHLLEDAIEWEYRQFVKHLRGWGPSGLGIAAHPQARVECSSG